MHAVLVLVLWLFGVSLIQLLPGALLVPAVALCLAAGGVFARVRMLRLVRRIRFLLLAIVVLFAWFTPGEAAIVDLPLLSPTREGALLALEHGGRLIAVVCCVALLLEALPPARLVSGMYVMCRPLALIGVPPERLALRLLLVLHYVETAGGDGARDWKTWLLDGDAGPAEKMLLSRETCSWVDVVALGLLAAFLAGAMLWGVR